MVISVHDMSLFKYFVFVNLALDVLGVDKTISDDSEFNSLDLTQKKKLIIDTDAGADDSVAILNLLGSEELFQDVEIQFISAVYGNTHVDNVARNVLKILKTVNRLDIPVYKGANQSLLITPEEENFFGVDGFGDFYFPDPPPEDLIEKKHAVSALIEEVNLYPGELTLVCLGPLTNIALAIRLYPEFLSKLKKIYLLGGSDSGIGNIKPGVEFNFYVDPEAAFIVFKKAEEKNIILNLVTWETAFERSVIDMKWRKEVLGKVKSPQIDLLNKAERLTLNGENWISSDTVLSATVLDDRLIETYDFYHADVETYGKHSRGAIFIDYKNTKDLVKNIRIIKKIKTVLFKKMLLQNLDSLGGQKNRASRL